MLKNLARLPKLPRSRPMNGKGSCQNRRGAGVGVQRSGRSFRSAQSADHIPAQWGAARIIETPG